MGIEDYKDVVGTCAMVTTMCQMLAGTFICKDIYKKGSTKGFDPMPFIGGIVMTILMLRYAFIVKDNVMINVNVFGVFTNFAYMSFYYLYAHDKTSTLNTLGKAIAFIAVVLGYAHIENEELIEFRYGVITTMLSLLLLASPLLHLGEIIRTKSTEVLPFPLIFMTTLVLFQWLLYGLIIDDAFVIFQNAVGFTLSAAQLSLFAIYPSTSVGQKDKSKDNKKDD